MIRRDLMGAGRSKASAYFQEQLIKVIKILIKRDVARQEASGGFYSDVLMSNSS